MPSCLDSLIGNDNGCVTTTGKLYLKDIGITNDFITGLLGSHNANLSDFMEERRRLATEAVVSDVVKHLNHQLIGHTFIDNDRLGTWPDNESLASAEAGYSNGIMVEVCTPESNTKINLSRLEFYGETTGTVTVTAYDLNDGTVLETWDIEAVAGEMASLEIDFSIQCRRQKKRIWITADEGTFYKTQMSGGCASCSADTWKHGVLMARSMRFADGDKVVYANILPTVNTGGLSVIASVSCDHEAFLCDMKSSMALAMVYRLGEEVMSNALYNWLRWGIQNFRQEDVKAQRDELAAKYATEMTNLLNWIKVPGDSVCFVCDRRTSTGVILP